MTYVHLRADCLYTGISSGPNAEYWVWESLYRYLFMAVLWNRTGHYIFALWFLLLLSFFPSFFFLAYHTSTRWCGLSANLRRRSDVCCTWLAENTGCKKIAKMHHLGTIAQLCRAISLQLRHISTIRKKLVKLQYLPHMFLQYGELWHTSSWDLFVSLVHPS